MRFDWLQLGIALTTLSIMVPVMFHFRRRRQQSPRIRFSSIKNMQAAPVGLKVRLRHLPFALRLAALGLLLLAFSHPYLEKEAAPSPPQPAGQEKAAQPEEQRRKIEMPTEGIAIQLLIDRSGSMGPQTGLGGVKYNYMKFENTLLSKLEVVKIISGRFIRGTRETNRPDELFSGRGQDLLGLFTFARYPLIASPLTLRHELLLDYISQLDPVKLREEDGTYIGYALERAILQIIDAKSRGKAADPYQIKSAIIILITDGAQVIREADRQDRHKALLPTEAAQLAKDNGIKIYAIAIAPRLIYDELGTVIGSADDFSVAEIKEAAELTGGLFYRAQDGEALLNIYRDIDQLEKSKLPEKKELEVRLEKSGNLEHQKTEKIELFLPLLWAGFLVMLTEILLTTIYFRRIP